MRTVLLLIATAAVSACASGSSERGEYSIQTGLGAPPPTEERTFYCPRSMSDCRAQANSYCGEHGYRRVRTPSNLQADMGEVGMARVGPGRSGVTSGEVRDRATTIGGDQDRNLTVECRQPPREEPEE